MASLSSLSFADLLKALSSAEPTPGGGSAAALGGALGAALLVMVARLPKTRTGAPEEAQALAAIAPRLVTIRDRLAALADEDTASYNGVTGAYKLPKGTDEEKAARTAAIRTAMRRATDVPLETMRAAADALGHAVTVAGAGNRNAASDAAAGIALLFAALKGAEGNVRINLASLPQDDYHVQMSADADRLADVGAAKASEAGEAIGEA